MATAATMQTVLRLVKLTANIAVKVMKFGQWMKELKPIRHNAERHEFS